MLRTPSELLRNDFVIESEAKIYRNPRKIQGGIHGGESTEFTKFGMVRNGFGMTRTRLANQNAAIHRVYREYLVQQRLRTQNCMKSALRKSFRTGKNREISLSQYFGMLRNDFGMVRNGGRISAHISMQIIPLVRAMAAGRYRISFGDSIKCLGRVSPNFATS